MTFLFFLPKFVIAQSPVRLLVAGIGDALATWFEAKVCADGRVKNMRGGASTRSALALAELCFKTLLADGMAAIEALQSREPNDALERLVEANTLLSGLGFESSGLAGAHAIHNGLTAAPGTHGYTLLNPPSSALPVQLAMRSRMNFEKNARRNKVDAPPGQGGIFASGKHSRVRPGRQSCQSQNH